MYEIREKRRVLPDGTRIATFCRVVASANVLEVEAGTTGYMGGDSGHGCRTFLRIADAGGTDMRVQPLGRFADEGFEMVLGGDCELSTLIEALRFAAQALEEQAEGAVA